MVELCRVEVDPVRTCPAAYFWPQPHGPYPIRQSREIILSRVELCDAWGYRRGGPCGDLPLEIAWALRARPQLHYFNLYIQRHHLYS